MDRDQILERLDDPIALETLYRESPRAFHRALMKAREARPDEIVLRVWEARLADGERTASGLRALIPAIAIALCCALLVRLPAVWLGAGWYYPRFAPMWILLGLAFYFWLERRDRSRLIAGLLLAAFVSAFASLLPGSTDSVVMALIHLPILFWVFLGFVFTGSSWRETEPRIRFLRYNGELLILGSLVALGGIVFSAITVALFDRISDGAEDWYFANIGVMGAAAVPIAGTYLYDKVFRRHTGIPSVLARVFAPLFLAMTVIYLLTAFLSGQNPFVDRSFLITVNGLLVMVLGMAVLSIAERGGDEEVRWVDAVYLALLMVTLLIDLLALSAIVFRLASYGFTPNRVVVLGANVAILVHLILVCHAHLGFVRGTAGLEGSRRAAAGFLPAYAAWAMIVCFVLPFIFRLS
jgi:ABC-type multidrug transport system fused ATPase/permease subunit